MEKRTNKKIAGITLIALVLTIIVMLILAGITINLTLGEDGIIKRAQEAGKNYTQAAEKEKIEIAEFSNLADKIIDNVTKNHYTMVDGVPVPKGFSPITTADQGTKETGFVIKNDTDGNEFVWVPVDSSTQYKYERVAFQKDGWIATQTLNSQTGGITRADYPDYIFIQEIPSDEETSVKTYSGFYIGRYECGVTGYDTNVSKENSNNLAEWTGYTNGKLVIQKGQQVWNYVTRDKARKVSEDLYKKAKGDSVNSKLCSSYAWDTALKFIETQNSVYPTDSVGGYYGQSAPTFTGYDTEHPCNIYDMGGNTWEWTTEVCTNKNFNCVARGGYYSDSSSSNTPAALRCCRSSDNAEDYISFRTTIYL